MLRSFSYAVFAGLVAAGTTAASAKAEKAELQRCEASYGTIAVVEGDNQGWSAHGLGSPRALINGMAMESGCFTPHDPASGRPADFLMSAIAGDKEEIDRSMELARTAAVEGLVRSGAAGTVLSRVPMGGAVLGLIGGFGGKKKTVAAGLKLLSPATGQSIATGQGVVSKTSVKFGGGAGWVQSASVSGYAGNKDGRMMAEAFLLAFNDLTSEAASMAVVAPPLSPAETAATDAAAQGLR